MTVRERLEAVSLWDARWQLSALLWLLVVSTAFGVSQAVRWRGYYTRAVIAFGAPVAELKTPTDTIDFVRAVESARPRISTTTMDLIVGVRRNAKTGKWEAER